MPPWYPGEYWETRRFRASNNFIAITTNPSRTCPQSPGGHSDDGEKKTADGRGADPQPRAYDSSLPPPPPPFPAPRRRGRASFFCRIRNVARRAMPYRREGQGCDFLCPQAAGGTSTPPVAPPPGEFWSLGHRDLLSPLVVF